MRLRILNILREREMSVGELVAATAANQANISKHLGTLLDAGVVARRKEGLNSFYRVSDESIFDLCDVVCTRLRDQLSARQSALAEIL
jgi:ArsR family transcriptional regulator